MTEATGMLRDQRRPGKVGADHQPAARPDAIEPDPGRQREDQVWQQPERGQRAHLARVGLKGQDRDERETELGDLVPEDRDRLAEPESPEIRCVEEERRQSAPKRAGTQTQLRAAAAAADGSGRGVVLLLGQLLLDLLVDLVLTVLPNTPDRVQPEDPRPDEGHDQPDRSDSAQLGADGVPRPVIQYTSKNASTPRMIPVIRRITVRGPPSLGQPPHMRRRRPC